jgi:hypothetical protein
MGIIYPISVHFEVEFFFDRNAAHEAESVIDKGAALWASMPGRQRNGAQFIQGA